MLVNPISFRLSISIFWKFTWSLYQYDNYKYLFYSDLVVFQYFLFFFRRLLKSKKTDYYVSHLRLYRVKKNVIINLFYYNPSEEIIYKYLKIHFFKHKKNILLKKKKFLKYWKKKKKHYFSLNFFLL